MAEASAIEARGVHKRFGRTTALAGVDVTVERGSIVGLLGPNGSGKSTFAKIVCGLVRPSAGVVQVAGAGAGSRAARTHIGYLAELFQFPPWLTGEELLRFHQRLAGSNGGDSEIEGLLAKVDLTDAGQRRIGGYSKGMQQRLGIAQALVGEPPLLLLDEPTSALDPVARKLVREILLDHQSRGGSVLLSSHLLSEVQDLADHVVLILRGNVELATSMAEITRAQGITVVTEHGEQVFEGVEHDAVPGLVARLIGEGHSIYEVRSHGSSLEQAYLDAVDGATS